MLICFAGMQLCFLTRQFSVSFHKKAMQEERGTHKNVQLSFTDAEWQQVQKPNDHEIVVGGKMFDIRGIRFLDGRVAVDGHFDTKEDELLASARELHKKNADHKSGSQPYFNFNLFCEELESGLNWDSILPGDKNLPGPASACLSATRDIDLPPPEFFI